LRNILAIKCEFIFGGFHDTFFLILGLKFELAIWDKSHSLLHEPHLFKENTRKPTRKPKSRIGGGGRV
jgi:hypothetical protein